MMHLGRKASQVALVVKNPPANAGWVLYASGFFCVSSHYLIIPRVSSLVVWGLGVSDPTPKARVLISG